MTKYFGATCRIGYMTNKELLGGIAALALIIVVATFKISANTSKCDFSDTFWANVEALGEGEYRVNTCFGMSGVSVPEDDWVREVRSCLRCAWHTVGLTTTVKECR